MLRMERGRRSGTEWLLWLKACDPPNSVPVVVYRQSQFRCYYVLSITCPIGLCLGCSYSLRCHPRPRFICAFASAFKSPSVCLVGLPDFDFSPFYCSVYCIVIKLLSTLVNIHLSTLYGGSPNWW